MSLDLSVHQSAEERGCDGGQSSHLHCGDKRREKCKSDPTPGAFNCAPSKRARQVHYLCCGLQVERGDFLFFFIFGAMGPRIISHPAVGEDRTVACAPKDSSM